MPYREKKHILNVVMFQIFVFILKILFQYLELYKIKKVHIYAYLSVHRVYINDHMFSNGYEEHGL